MRALVLSGGGSKGQFHVGWAKRRIGELEIKYDVLCGVSVGALVVGSLAQFPHGQEKEAAAALVDLFSAVQTKNIWKHWWLFHEAAGLWKPAMRNSTPLQELVRTKLDMEKVKASGRKLRVGAVNLSAGEYKIFDESCSDLAGALLASSSFPGFFLPVRMGGQWWTDGGVQAVTPIKAAIDAGATDIDVVVTEPKEALPEFDKDPETSDVLLRSLELMCHRLTWVDIEYARLVNELVAKGAAPGKRVVNITVSAPDEPLNDDSLTFDPKEATHIQLLGYKAAQALEPKE